MALTDGCWLDWVVEGRWHTCAWRESTQSRRPTTRPSNTSTLPSSWPTSAATLPPRPPPPPILPPAFPLPRRPSLRPALLFAPGMRCGCDDATSAGGAPHPAALLHFPPRWFPPISPAAAQQSAWVARCVPLPRAGHPLWCPPLEPAAQIRPAGRTHAVPITDRGCCGVGRRA